jgi:hypothetical protein
MTRHGSNGTGYNGQSVSGGAVLILTVTAFVSSSKLEFNVHNSYKRKASPYCSYSTLLATK